MGISASIHEVLTGTLAELGIPAPTDIIQTVLMKDRYFFGHKFRYDDGFAILNAGSNIVEFFSEQGTLLKAIAVEDEKEYAA